ncbi:MAG: M16 family metallopeptidase [Phycisphaerales bacterium]
MPVAFRHHTLPNGLTIIAETDEAAMTAAAGFFVRTGARDEAGAIMGVSHFLEHMMFKGTPTRTSDDINRAFDEIGAKANAYTSNELTAFHAATLPEHLTAALDVLADMMRPALRETDFSTERGVILEEIAMYEDEPMWVLYERCLEEHFGAHPLSHRVLGTKATISALQAPQMRGYFEHRYSADNTTLALAGRVDFDAVVRHAERVCGHWQRTGAQRDAASPPAAGKHFQITSDKVARAYLMVLAPGPGAADPRRYAASVAALALGAPDNSRLHWALIETGIAEEASSGVETLDGTGLWQVFLGCDPDRIDEAEAIVQREIDALAANITDDDVIRIKARVATSAILAGERPDGRMHRIGRQWTSLGTHTTLEEEVRRIDELTTHDVRRVLSELPWSPRTVGRLLPA